MTQTTQAPSTSEQEQDSYRVAVQWLPPTELLLDLNARTELDLDEDFLASVRELGVLQPITAVRSANGVRVRFGHRRCLAASRVGQERVPVLIVADEQTDDAAQVERLVQQYAENQHRTGLNDVDRIGTVQQLSAFGVSVTKIAQKTRMPKAQVKAAIAVSKSEPAMTAAARYDLTIEQAAVLLEFQDDPEAVDELTEAAATDQFEHVTQCLRDERQYRAEQAAAEQAKREEQAALRAELAAAGVTILDQIPQRADLLHWLTDDLQTREPLTEATHAACPGHAAILRKEPIWIETEPETPPADRPDEGGESDTEEGDTEEGDTEEGDTDAAEDTDQVSTRPSRRMELQWRPAYLCADPNEHGHHQIHAARNSAPTDEDDEQKAAARRASVREARDCNKLWESAAKVRLRWVKNWLTRKGLPKGKNCSQFIAHATADHCDLLSKSGVSHLAATLLGAPATAATYGRSTALDDFIDNASDARAQVILLSILWAGYENAADREHWRTLNDRTRHYLTHLESLGYPLSEIEARACGRTPAKDDVLTDTDTPDQDDNQEEQHQEEQHQEEQHQEEQQHEDAEDNGEQVFGPGPGEGTSDQ